MINDSKCQLTYVSVSSTEECIYVLDRSIHFCYMWLLENVLTKRIFLPQGKIVIPGFKAKKIYGDYLKTRLSEMKAARLMRNQVLYWKNILKNEKLGKQSPWINIWKEYFINYVMEELKVKQPNPLHLSPSMIKEPSDHLYPIYDVPPTWS